MPRIHANATDLHYVDTGAGASGETVVFSHGLLWGVEQFEHQIAALREAYRCVAYDHRGQRRSADGDGRSISLDLLTDDALALCDALGLAQVHWVGLSMGGMVGMRLALRAPDRIRSLVLLETRAAEEAAENRPGYRRLALAARIVGPKLLTGKVMPLMFGPTFLDDPAKEADRRRWRAYLQANRRSIWRAVNGVLHRDSVLDDLPAISAPTLVVVGEEDVATPVADAEAIAERVPDARLVRIPGAGHSSTVEQPEAVTAALETFLDGVRTA